MRMKTCKPGLCAPGCYNGNGTDGRGTAVDDELAGIAGTAAPDAPQSEAGTRWAKRRRVRRLSAGGAGRGGEALSGGRLAGRRVQDSLHGRAADIAGRRLGGGGGGASSAHHGKPSQTVEEEEEEEEGGGKFAVEGERTPLMEVGASKWAGAAMVKHSRHKHSRNMPTPAPAPMLQSLLSYSL
jgi:hypothetical protein